MTFVNILTVLFHSLPLYNQQIRLLLKLAWKLTLSIF